MRRIFCLPTMLVLLLGGSPAWGRTVVGTDEECVRTAALAPDAPLLSWAGDQVSPGVYSTKTSLHLKSGKAFLIAFPLDKIPKGQRITNAELVVPVHHVEGETRLTIRRLLGAWGAGVCHKYRTVRPRPVAWTGPGASGASDQATRLSARVAVKSRGDKAVNVTEDVELWYTGASKNQGWVVRVDDPNAEIHLLSPVSTYPNGIGRWKLRITYEPE